MSHPEFYVIRHGETEWNREGRWQGRLDSPLTDLGRRQADAMAARLAEMGISGATHALKVSPLGRTRATAIPIAAAMNCSPVIDDNLAEIDVGEWSGLTQGERLGGDAPDEWMHDMAPGGEGYEGVWRRVGVVLETLDRPTVFVTHGITSRMLRARALGLGIAGGLELPGGQGVFFRIRNGVHELV